MALYPWASGLARLIAERHLAKGDIAARAELSAARISELLYPEGRPGKTPPKKVKIPNLATLMAVADAITSLSREKDPKAPAVEMWEFFVSDEQAEVLRGRVQRDSELLQPSLLQQLQQQITAQNELVGRLAQAAGISATVPAPSTEPQPVAAGAAFRKKKAR